MTYLRPRRPSDDEHIVNWRNQSVEHFISSGKITVESHRAWMEQQDQKYFVCECGNTPVGVVALYNINQDHMHAEYGRLLVAPHERGKGYGRFMLQGILAYGFDMGLNSIYGHILANNTPAWELARSVGLGWQGTYLQHIFKCGLYVDVIRVGMIAFDFHKVEWSREVSVYL